MKQKRLFSTVEAIKSVMIFLLIVLMLVLVILLVIGQNSTMEETLPQADRMVIYASGEQSKYASGMDTARVSPYLLAYRRWGGDTCVIHAADARQKPYEVLYPLLRELFGAGSVGYAMEDETGVSLWSVCMEMSEVVYVRYNSALPSSVIRAYTYSEEDSETVTAVLDESAGGAAAYVRELFLVSAELLMQSEVPLPGDLLLEETAICAVTSDDRGDVTLFAPGTLLQKPAVTAVTELQTDASGEHAPAVAAAENHSALDTYIASMAALSSQTQTGTLQTSGTAFGTTVLLDGIYAMPQITRQMYDPGQLYDDPQKLLSVLGLLGLREGDIDNYYTDGAGDRIYLNASGRLTVSGTTSVIRYVSLLEGGLDPADYLGYASIGQEYLLPEYLRAADKLLSQLSLSGAILGGDALSCSLIGVEIISEENTDTLRLTYGYTYRGIPLLDARGEILPAMLLQASGGVITYLELHPCSAELSSEEDYLLPQSVMAEAMALEQAPDAVSGNEEADLAETAETAAPIPLYMAYLCESTDGYGIFSADWIGLQQH